MDTNRIVDIIEGLPEEKQSEVLDFAKFLRYQAAKERILASDKGARIGFANAEELLDAIDDAD